MVKIVQAFNFASQNTFSLSGEILSATLLEGERVAISTAGNFIEILNLNQNQQQNGSGETSTEDYQSRKHNLPTVGEVIKLIYCHSGKYLLTLEKEATSSPIHKTTSNINCSGGSTTTVLAKEDTKVFVRAYANLWLFSDSKLAETPITIRIASMTTPKMPLTRQLDVIELPLHCIPDLIECCQVYYYDHFDVSHIYSTLYTPPSLNHSYGNCGNDSVRDDSTFTQPKTENVSTQTVSPTHSTNSSIFADDYHQSTTNNNNNLNEILFENRRFFSHSTKSVQGGAGLQEAQECCLHNQYHRHQPNDGDATNEEIYLKGLKILLRMYLGRLKALSDLMQGTESADAERLRSDNVRFHDLRVEGIRLTNIHLKGIREQEILVNNKRRTSGDALESAPHIFQHPNYYYSSETRLKFENYLTNKNKCLSMPYIPNYALSTTASSFKSYIRPIPCLNERPQFLNRLPPFKPEHFRLPNCNNDRSGTRFMEWENETLTLTLKIQSLLASPNINREVIEEFVAYVEEYPDIIGVDSFLIVILPKPLAINYMMNYSPANIWAFGKSYNFTTKDWESLFRKLYKNQNLVSDWEVYVTDVLNNLVAELTFDELLQCLPIEVISNYHQQEACVFPVHIKEACFLEGIDKCTIEDEDNGDNPGIRNVGGGHYVKIPYQTMALKREHHPMDNVNENNVFEKVLRKAVAKQRSLALRSMIESTGVQLYESSNSSTCNQ